MRRFLAALIPLMALSLDPLSSFAKVDQPLLAQRGPERERAQKKKKETISADVNIKGIDPKRLLFDTPINTTNEPITKVLYDRAVEGDMCFMSCNFYNGVTSKWSDFFVDLQPFENFCMTFTGCSSQYPTPSEEVILKIGDTSHTLKMSDLSQNRFYIPLAARKEIATNNGEIIIEIRGVKMPSYRIGAGNRETLRALVNETEELAEYTTKNEQKTLKEQLVEAENLYDSGLITQAEYEEMRKRILDSSN